MEESFISTQDACCRNAFARLISVAGPDDGANIIEQFDRFKIWSANFGANQTGDEYPKSLDYRLRNARTYKEQILAILGQLVEYLQEAEILVQGAGNLQKPETDNEEDVGSDSVDGEDDGPLGRWTLSDSEDEIADDRSCRATQRTTTGLESLSNDTSSPLAVTISSIGFAVNCLYRIPIRDPASYRRLQRYASAVEDHHFDIYHHFDRMFVLDALRFLRAREDAPLVSSKISTRLARLVTERRKTLRFRKMHNEELRQKKSESAESKPAVPKSSAKGKHPVSTVQTDQLKGAEHATVTVPNSSLKATTFRPKDADSPHMDQSQALAEIEVDDMSSVATTTLDKEIIHIPSRPRDAHGLEFEDFVCPYCWTAVNIRSDASWKRHVLQDLEPYVCTYADCQQPDQLYKHRDDWWRHESQHYVSLACGEEKHGLYTAEEEFIAHMASAHGQPPESFSIPSILNTFRRAGRSTIGSCQFCGKTTSSLKQHVGRHLQRMALFALPKHASAADHSELAPGSLRSSRYAVMSGHTIDSATRSTVSPDEGSASEQSSQAGVELPPMVSELVNTSWEPVRSMFEGNAPLKTAEPANRAADDMPSGLRTVGRQQGASGEEIRPTRAGKMPSMITEFALTVGENLATLRSETSKPGAHGVAIRGASGSGKTHLGLQYLWAYKDLYKETFWIDCQTIDKMDAWFDDIWDQLIPHRDVLHNIYEDVFAYLAQSDGWLLILDELTSETMMYLNSLDLDIVISSGSHLLYTSTRNEGLRTPPGLRFPVMEIPPLTEAEALQLLQQQGLGPEADFSTLEVLYPAAVLAMASKSRFSEVDSGASSVYSTKRGTEAEKRHRDDIGQAQQAGGNAIDEIGTSTSSTHNSMPADARIASVLPPSPTGSPDIYKAVSHPRLSADPSLWFYCFGEQLDDVEHGGRRYHCWMPSGPLGEEWDELKPAYMASLEQLPSRSSEPIEVDMIILNQRLHTDEAKIYILVRCPNRERASAARRYLHGSHLSLDRGFRFISATKWPYKLPEDEELFYDENPSGRLLYPD